MDPDANHRSWAERSGEYSPEYYAQIGSNAVSETLLDVLDHYVREDADVLELGCGSGRHLDHLRAHGYENLAGVDINDESFDVMAEQYPRLADVGAFHAGAIESVLPEFADGAFDVVYSVETLQHIHDDDAWVFEEVVRVSSDLVVTAENEGNGPDRGRGENDVNYVNDEFPLYYRNWKRIFTDLGCAQLLRDPTERDTVRVFRVP